jgi:hypothetical protein
MGPGVRRDDGRAVVLRIQFSNSLGPSLRANGSRECAPEQVVVPAKAGTHTPRPCFERRCSTAFAQPQPPVVMGPGVRRDDGRAVVLRIQFSNSLGPSLRANGSRECAPDDRLREAIHSRAMKEAGLLRRFRLRSLSYGGQVARNDVRIRARILAARCARAMQEPFSLEMRAWGTPGAHRTHSLACEMGSEHTSVVTAVTAGITRRSRTQWF